MKQSARSYCTTNGTQKLAELTDRQGQMPCLSLLDQRVSLSDGTLPKTSESISHKMEEISSPSRQVLGPGRFTGEERTQIKLIIIKTVVEGVAPEAVSEAHHKIIIEEKSYMRFF